MLTENELLMAAQWAMEEILTPDELLSSKVAVVTRQGVVWPGRNGKRARE